MFTRASEKINIGPIVERLGKTQVIPLHLSTGPRLRIGVYEVISEQLKHCSPQHVLFTRPPARKGYALEISCMMIAVRGGAALQGFHFQEKKKSLYYSKMSKYAPLLTYSIMSNYSESGALHLPAA